MMKPLGTLTLTIGMAVMIMTNSQAQQFEANYDESKVPNYELPDPLVLSDGTPVEDAETWKNKRRPEILKLFETHVYGKTPEKTWKPAYKVHTDIQALDGKATRKIVTIFPTGETDEFAFDVLFYLPNHVDEPAAVFLTNNFRGNHTIHPDPEIPISDNSRMMYKRMNNGEEVDMEKTRGERISRWPVEMIVESGYGLATIFYGDVDPDFDDGFQNGIHPLFYEEGQDKPKPDEWGSIGAWAWGLSRAMDYIEKDEDIDENKVAVMGHSRLGKTSLWAGAQDQRFSIVISNSSGCGGAALSRRAFGETVGRINSSFPHWFCDNFNKYNENESELPVDQHMLIALMAPRPVYVASAEEDRWADPRGEFLACKHADPVYELLGLEGLPVEEMPEVDQPVHGTIGYHIRSGGHDVKEFDWNQYIRFANKHFSE